LTMEVLTRMQNIYKEVEMKLVQSGILTYAELMKGGSKNAIIRIREYDVGAYLSIHSGMERAIREICWHDLSINVKSDLREFSKLKKIR